MSGLGALFVGIAALLIIFFGFSRLPLVSSAIYLGGILLFLGMIVVFPALRLNRSQVLSPRNLMLLSIALKILVVPVLIALFDYSYGVLPNLPSDRYTHMAHGIYLVAMAACMLGFLFGFRQPTQEIRWVTPNWFMWSVILLSFTASAIYPFQNLQQLTGGGGGTSLLSIALTFVLFFKGLAPLGIFYLLFRRGRGQTQQAFTLGKFIVGLVLLIAVSLSVNRASIIYPALAFFTVYSLKNPRIKYWQVILAGLIALTGLFWFGQARERYILGDYVYQQRKHLSQMNNAVNNAQVYFNGPQFGGYALRELEGRYATAPASFLESAPKIGERFRNTSGSYWYNFTIYRNTGIRDQVYPAQIEIYNNYGWVGIALVYALIGYVLAQLHRTFTRATNNPMLAYITAYLTLLLCAFLNLSLSVAGQFLLYSSLPLLGFWWWMHFRKYS